jgi:hypothetical protein
MCGTLAAGGAGVGVADGAGAGATTRSRTFDAIHTADAKTRTIPPTWSHRVRVMVLAASRDMP